MVRSLALAGIAAVAVAIGAARAQMGDTGQAPGETRGAQTSEWVDTALHVITRAIEFAGIGAIVIGAIVATAIYARRMLAGGGEEDYHDYRARLGRSILLGLEFLVAADIIATVAIEPTLDSVIVLAGVVLIRTFLSFALEVEIEGRWPWQNGQHAPAQRRQQRREAQEQREGGDREGGG
ncbi:DUF1622 domain-containing protein [Salinarimonas sp.]|uniref:DUF1622 domain-containing protein n=1 Tax=Salinarimonas sp. TaxID=2766526 RepID=UPI0032D8D098